MRSISVVIDKRNKPENFNVFEAAWGTIIERFESSIQAMALPNPTLNTAFREHGFIIVDETDERRLCTLVRGNALPCRFPCRAVPGRR